MTLDMGGLASGPDPHAMAAVHQWRASLLSNLINPNYQLFSQHSDGIFKIPAPHSPLRGEFPQPENAPRLPVRVGLAAGGGGPGRETPGPVISSRESPVSGRLASWQHDHRAEEAVSILIDHTLQVGDEEWILKLESQL